MNQKIKEEYRIEYFMDYQKEQSLDDWTANWAPYVKFVMAHSEDDARQEFLKMEGSRGSEIVKVKRRPPDLFHPRGCPGCNLNEIAPCMKKMRIEFGPAVYGCWAMLAKVKCGNCGRMWMATNSSLEDYEAGKGNIYTFQI